MSTTIMPGIWPDMSHGEYLLAPGVSKSKLDKFRKCPADYRDFVAGRIVDYQTADMRFGSRLHHAVLFGRPDWVVHPAIYPPDNKPWTMAAGYCKQWIAEQVLPVVSPSEDADLKACVEAVKLDYRACEILCDGQPEASMFAEYAGMLVKGRADWLAENRIVELKKTNDASTDQFSRTIGFMRYHVQAALYWKIATILGRRIDAFYFIAVEPPDKYTKRPARVNVRKLADKDLELGLADLDRDLAELKACEETNFWPSYSGAGSDIQEITLPQWYHRDEELELIVSGQKTTI